MLQSSIKNWKKQVNNPDHILNKLTKDLENTQAK